MREILFRGLAPKIDGEWHYGSFIKNTQQDFDCYIQEDDGTVVLIDYDTIGQYTGLKDKNGKKIFEGDICKGNEFSDEQDLFVIKYGKYKTSDWKEKYVSNTYQYGWFAEYIKTKEQVHLVSPNGIEVIGNILDKGSDK